MARSFISEILDEHLKLVVLSIIRDGVACGTVIIVELVMFLMLKLLGLFGYPHSFIQFFEVVLVCGAVATLALLVVSLFMKLLVETGIRKHLVESGIVKKGQD